MTRGASSTVSPGQSIVSCSVGDRAFAMLGADAREVVRAERLRPVAGTDGSVGTLIAGGEQVPVYPLAWVLGLPSNPEAGVKTAGNHVVVTRGPAGAVGWLVDRIVRSVLPEGTELRRLPEIVGPSAGRWFQGVLHIGDQSLLLLSPDDLDPRAASDVRCDHGQSAVAAEDAHGVLASESGSPLVVIFSSPTLPSAGVRRFALSGRRVAAVVRALPMISLPGSRPHVTGLMAWRDSVVAVIDMRDEAERLASPAADRYLVARSGAAMVAFAVTAQVSLHEPTRADRLIPDAGGMNTPFVKGVFAVGGERVALLDLDAMLARVSQPGASGPLGGPAESDERQADSDPIDGLAPGLSTPEYL